MVTLAEAPEAEVLVVAVTEAPEAEVLVVAVAEALEATIEHLEAEALHGG